MRNLALVGGPDSRRVDSARAAPRSRVWFALVVARRSVRVIPERTVDAWFSWQVIRAIPQALLWAPTPPAQAAAQPWDFVVGGFDEPHKLFVVETKALIGYEDAPLLPKVSLRLPQLLMLASLAAANDFPVFYGLPLLPASELPTPLLPEFPPERAILRLEPPFAEWLRMFTPFELMAQPAIATALADPTRSSVSVSTTEFIGGESLDAFLAKVKRCEIGRRYEGPGTRRILPVIPSELDARLAAGEAVAQSHVSELIRTRLAAAYEMSDTQSSASEWGWKENHLARTTWTWVPVSGDYL